MNRIPRFSIKSEDFSCLLSSLLHQSWLRSLLFPHHPSVIFIQPATVCSAVGTERTPICPAVAKYIKHRLISVQSTFHLKYFSSLLWLFIINFRCLFVTFSFWKLFFFCHWYIPAKKPSKFYESRDYCDVNTVILALQIQPRSSALRRVYTLYGKHSLNTWGSDPKQIIHRDLCLWKCHRLDVFTFLQRFLSSVVARQDGILCSKQRKGNCEAL